MSSSRLVLLAAACALYGQVVMADNRKNETKVTISGNSEKTKRDVNIIGPIPTSYRGQAKGQTTFDGILANELTLPKNNFGQFQASNAFSQSQAQNDVGFGRFQFESRPNVYNFDGKELYTYDGVLASDLTVPYAQYTVLNQQPSPGQPQQFRQRLPQTASSAVFQPFPRQEQNFATIYNKDLTLPSSASNQIETFQPAGSVPTFDDPSQFQAETPTERYNRLQQQYRDALAEYRKSLLRFQQQLRKYSSFSKKK